MTPTINRNSVILSLRGTFLATAFMILALSALTVPVQAQTVTVAKVDHPQSVVYGGSELLSVQALIEYSRAGKGTDYLLTVTLLDLAANSSIRGNDVTLIANPTPCGGIPNYVPQGSTFCPVVLRSPNGSETVQFSFSSSHAAVPPVWNLAIRAALGQVNAPLPSATNMYNFTIPVTAQQEFVSTLPTNPTASPEIDAGSSSQIEFIVLVIFVLFLLMTVYAVWPKKKRPKARRRR
jgi:hypothetical protein